MYGHDCLSGIVRTSDPEEQYREEVYRFITGYRQMRKRLRLDLKLTDGKPDKQYMDYLYGRPIDEIRAEEEERRRKEQEVDAWTEPDAHTIILDCLNGLHTLRQASKKKVRSPKYRVDPEKVKKLYLDAVETRMAMKFRCPAKYARNMICKAKVLDQYWYEVTVPMKEMLAAANITFDGVKFSVNGKDIPLSDFGL